jgi:hypothetical protein
MMYTETCCKCGIQFSIPDEYLNKLRRCHNTFYCPNGHPQYYPGKTDEEKKIEALERQVNFFKDDRDYYKNLYHEVFRSRAYYKGLVTRLTNQRKKKK